MALIDSCVLWNKLGNNVETTNSEIGSNFTVGGAPDYQPCKFGNGIRIDANTEIVSIANTPAQYDFAKGAIEMWVKIPYSVVNGIPDNGANSSLFDWYDAGVGWKSVFFHQANNFWWILRDNNNKDWSTNDPDIDIAANTLAHLIFAWDRTHATKKRRLYIDGVEASFNNTAWNDVDMTGANFILGQWFGLTNNFNGIIDNIKWYNNSTDATITDIIANKDNEGWPVAGGGRLIDGGLMMSNMIDGSVLIN